MKSLPLLATALLLSIATGAVAQTPPRAAPPAATTPTPDRTTASFGDWILRCDRRTDVTPPQRFCEVGQTIQRAGDAGPQAQVGLGKIDKSEPLRLTVLLPVSVTFAGNAKLLGDGPLADLVWLRCLPAGCFASAPVPDELLKKFRAMKDAARLEYKDGAGRDVSLSISFRGFNEAMDALQRENSQ
jgi:invasion protein IalB